MGVDQRGVDLAEALAKVNTQDMPKFGSTQMVNPCGAASFMAITGRRLVLQQQGRELFPSGRTRLGHRLVNVAFDGAHRKGQAFRDIAVGQALDNQQRDLTFPIGERQRHTRFAKRRCIGAAALFGQCFRPPSTAQRRSA